MAETRLGSRRVAGAALPWARSVLPGLGLCGAVAAGASLLAGAEALVFGGPGVGTIVWALLLGIIVRAMWLPHSGFEPGIQLSARRVLEFAVMLFGALLSLDALLSLGPALALGIPVAVAGTMVGSYASGRALGVRPEMAALIASGNAICGNSAIAATRTVTGAAPADVTASIALTAFPGLLVTLALPLVAPLSGLGGAEYGVLAGMMVYAVPQVFAATAPIGALSLQVGVLVKLTRVLMLGPALVFWSLVFAQERVRGRRMLLRLAPWYVIGFFALAGARMAGLLPEGLTSSFGSCANWLTALAMAALGLETDLRTLRRYGWREITTVIVSVVILSFSAIALLLLAR